MTGPSETNPPRDWTGAFVLSSGRSGSTMLSDILASHPDIASLSEVLTYLGTRSLLPGRVSGARYWRRLSQQTPLYRQLFTAATAPREFLYPGTGGRFPHDDVPPILATTLPHLTDRPDALYDALARTVPRQPRQTMAAHHRALFDRLARETGARIWVERSGLSLMHSRVLRRDFPAARFVLLTRDGRDVALSLRDFIPARLIIWSWFLFRRLGANPIAIAAPTGASRRLRLFEALFTPVFPVRRALATPPPLTACAGFWSEMVLAALPEYLALLPDRRMRLDFETLCANPGSEIERLTRFLGVDVPPAWLDRAAQIPAPRPPRWPRLAPDDRRALSEATEQARAALAALTTC